MDKVSLTRRKFITQAGITSACVGLMPLGSVSSFIYPETLSSTLTSKMVPVGKWIPVSCWHDCGGRCALKAYVQNNRIIRVKSDDSHPDTPDNPQQRACQRGRSQKMQVLGPDRLKYPVKRKQWEPGGGGKEFRGGDEWIRISWDEALKLVTEEIKRVKEQFGNKAIYCRGGEIKRTLNLYGGCVDSWMTDSLGSWMGTGKRIGLYPKRSNGGFNPFESIGDRMNLRHSKLVIMWGLNPAWSSPGSPTYHFLQVKKAGAKFIFIDPYFSSTASILADNWYPVRPGTDHAMILGMMHTLLTEDDPVDNPLIDWDFLNRCTIGFDASHMPDGADPTENFRDYLTGETDTVAKSAEWASSICGIPSESIRKLAREIATEKKVALLSGWAPARINNGDSWPQAFMTLGCMTGHFGEVGRMTGTSTHIASGNGGPRLVFAGDPGLPEIPNPVGGGSGYVSGKPDHGICIPGNQIWDAMLNGEYTAGRNDIRKVDIRLMYNGGITNMLGSREGQTKGLEAVKKPEFIVTHAHFLNTTAQYSDIVLPITTQWERDGLVQDDGNREVIFFGSRAVDPLGEARDDMWIAREIGAGLGIERAFIEPVSKEQQLFNAVSGAQVINAAGDGYEPLVTITEKDLDDLGVHGKPQKGKISYNEFRANGLYQVSRSPDDNLMHIPFKDFRNDPVMHPLQTSSGRLEIHCRELEQFVQGCGWSTIKPFPAYLPAEEGYEGTLSDQTGIRRGKYTLQFYSVHYPRRAGTTYDNVSWLREAWPHEFYMNTLDAEQRGISDGDTIKVRSRNGCIIRQVKVTPRMRPGVTCLGAGAWAHFDHTLKADLSGSANILTGAVRTGQGTSGWNTVLVEVEKLEYPLPPDHLIPSEALI